METTSAKEIVSTYKLKRQKLIDIVRSGKVTIYNEWDNVVTLEEHQKELERRLYFYADINFDEVLRTEEYGLIIESYYFYESDFDKVYKDMFPDKAVQSDNYVEMIAGKYVVRVPPSVWVNKTPEMIYEAMNGKYHDAVIARVLMDKKGKRFTKAKVGQLFYELDDKSRDDSTFRDKVTQLEKEYDEQYHIIYE